MVVVRGAKRREDLAEAVTGRVEVGERGKNEALAVFSSNVVKRTHRMVAQTGDKLQSRCPGHCI